MVEPEGQTEYHREVAAGMVQQVAARLVLVRTVQTRSSEQQAGSLAEKAEREVHRGWKRVHRSLIHRHRKGHSLTEPARVVAAEARTAAVPVEARRTGPHTHMRKCLVEEEQPPGQC